MTIEFELSVLTSPEDALIDIPLNVSTPTGIFESDSGNRYMVSVEQNNKIAIVLRHSRRPAFSWSKLAHSPLEQGNWLGDCELELTYRVTGRSESSYGQICLDSDDASVFCHAEHGDTNWLAIGTAGYSDLYGQYVGWRLLKNGQVFFEQKPDDVDWLKVLPLKRPYTVQ